MRVVFTSYQDLENIIKYNEINYIKNNRQKKIKREGLKNMSI